jgi:transposase
MTENRTLTMTQKEINRCEILRMADERKITQKAGAGKIRVTERHFRRLLNRYRRQGPEGIISRHRGKRSNNRMPDKKKEKILKKLKEEYLGFGPTLACEKLAKRDGVKVSKETVRQIMIAAALHQAKTRKKDRTYPLRERRKRRGELVQIDGSYHAWLEERAEKACLLLFVDDATSEILAAEFVPHESYTAYTGLCKRYFQQHGLPEAFYADRFSVFRVNHTNVTTTDAQTQFERALEELGIELICAYSPQAKGRVERANQTLQDRLVKELRLAGINDYQEANAFLRDYIAEYNQMFSVQPILPTDCHEPLRPENDLDLIFTQRFTRILSKDLQFQFERTVYQVLTDRPAYALRGREVEVCQSENGKIAVLLNGEKLDFKRFVRQPKQQPLSTGKDLEWKPPADHPWRRYGHKIKENRVQVPN